jgi:predicted nucleotidyltransferase
VTDFAALLRLLTQHHVEFIIVGGAAALCINLEGLIKVKRAAGRPKDLETIAELEQILSETQREAEQ